MSQGRGDCPAGCKVICARKLPTEAEHRAAHRGGPNVTDTQANGSEIDHCFPQASSHSRQKEKCDRFCKGYNLIQVEHVSRESDL